MSPSKFCSFKDSHKIQFFLASATLVFVLFLAVNWYQNNEVLFVKSTLPNCDCLRTVYNFAKNDAPKEAICDAYTNSRQNGQKIVAYSYYGNSSNGRVSSHYLNQIAQRAHEIKHHYPNWIMRIYYHIEDDDVQSAKVLCENWCQNPHLDLCDVTQLPVLGDLKKLQPIGTYVALYYNKSKITFGDYHY